MNSRSPDTNAPIPSATTGSPAASQTGGLAPRILRIAYQGEPEAFGEVAIRGRWGEDAVPVPCPRFEDVGRLLVERGAECAVLPIDNSTIGAIHAAIEVIEQFGLSITGYYTLPVRHCLLGLAGACLYSLRSVRSHPAALAQCARFLRAHAWLNAEPGLDTAGAACEIARVRDPAIAAIASRAAAARYGLDVLAADIQDAPDNRTRFAIVERRP